MTYVIKRYETRVLEATRLRGEKIALATQKWNEVVGAILAEWQGECTEAEIELQLGLQAATRAYVEGEGRAAEPPSEPQPLGPRFAEPPATPLPRTTQLDLFKQASQENPQ